MTEKAVVIYTSVRDGRALQRAHPEIADDYRGGMTLRAIAEKYDVYTLFGVKKKNTAEVIVHYALAGCNYNFEDTQRKPFRPYRGLIPQTEMRKLTAEHMKANGKRHKDNGSGIFGLDANQRKKNASKAGKLGGAKGARKAHLNRGNVLWEDVEITAYALMTRDPEYHAEGDINKRLDRTKIAEKGNALFHNGRNVRNPESIGTMLYRERKQIASFFSFLEEMCA